MAGKSVYSKWKDWRGSSEFIALTSVIFLNPYKNVCHKTLSGFPGSTSAHIRYHHEQHITSTHILPPLSHPTISLSNLRWARQPNHQAVCKARVSERQKTKAFTCETTGPVSEGPGPPLPPACPLTGAGEHWDGDSTGIISNCHSLCPFGYKHSFKGSKGFATITALYENISTKLCKNSIIGVFWKY